MSKKDGSLAVQAWTQPQPPPRTRGQAPTDDYPKSLEIPGQAQALPAAGAASPVAGEPPVRWLTATELECWLSVVRLTIWLPWAIDQRLRRDCDLGLAEYQVLAMLSQRPGRALRMSTLAQLTNVSLSRLSHLVTRMERRELARREPDPADGRFTNAILTDKGYETLVEAAPGHVAHVRSLIVDVLSSEELRRLGRVADRIVSRIDTSGIG